MKISNVILSVLFALFALCFAQTANGLQEYLLYSVEELQSDFKQMRKTLEEDHANVYEYVNKTELDKLFNDQYEKIQQPLTLIEFFKLLTPITARIGCGHTNLWMPGGFWNLGPYNLFPLQIDFMQNDVVVTGDYNTESTVPVGSIILDINGVPINQIWDEMKTNYSADALNVNFIQAQIKRRFSMIYARRFGFPEEFVVTYALPDRKTSATEKLQPASISSVREVVFKNFDHPELGFDIFEDSSTAIMTIQTFIYYDQVEMFKDFLEKSFFEIKEKKIRNLILDLRGNDGGDPFCAAPLLSYLEPKPKPYFAESYGKYVQLAVPIPLAEHNFKGKLYTLIDGRCNSTNGHFCALLQYHKIGEFIGTEGGATYKCNAGKNTQIDLNKTGIMLYFGRSTYTAAVKNMDKTHGILPDHFVEQTYKDFLNNKDTVLEYTVDLIKSRKEK